MSALSASLLRQTIDDHILWMTAWTRSALGLKSSRVSMPAIVTPPDSYAHWRRQVLLDLQPQPALDGLSDLHDQMHRAARLVILKMMEGSIVSTDDYDSVTLPYHEFIFGLRRFERALATAQSGLDVLTGLRSRSGMREEMVREISRFSRHGKVFCLALADIDHFKNVNDTYGHDNGDLVLSTVANIISRHIRSFDDVWRWGGEEFLLCLKEADLVAGTTALEHVRAIVETTPVKLTTGQAISVTASFGIVAATPDISIDALLEAADKALYRAKSKGRNQVAS